MCGQTVLYSWENERISWCDVYAAETEIQQSLCKCLYNDCCIFHIAGYLGRPIVFHFTRSMRSLFNEMKEKFVTCQLLHEPW